VAIVALVAIPLASFISARKFATASAAVRSLKQGITRR
jgi:hypothetical protein